jgi:hypothetical protein
MQNSTATLEDKFGGFLENSRFLPYDPAIMLLGIYPKEWKTYVHTKTRTQMFIAALFIIAKRWAQLRCPSMGDWTKSCGMSIQLDITQF